MVSCPRAFTGRYNAVSGLITCHHCDPLLRSAGACTQLAYRSKIGFNKVSSRRPVGCLVPRLFRVFHSQSWTNFWLNPSS